MDQQFNCTTLSGDWYNQLGSKMNLVVESTGALSGKYNSAVGTAEDFYILTGRFDAVPPPGTGASVGWVVTYRNTKLNAHSTATWSGQYFQRDQKIITNWLLTSSTPTASLWDSTNVGNDTFTRKKPSAAEIATANELGFGSPHPEEIFAAKFA